MSAHQTDAELRRWRALCAELLPPMLRAELLGATRPVSLVVVPHGQLAAFPWAALRLDDGRALVETAVIQLVPSLSLLDRSSTWPPIGSGKELVSYLDPELSTREEHTSLSALGHQPVTDGPAWRMLCGQARPPGRTSPRTATDSAWPSTSSSTAKPAISAVGARGSRLPSRPNARSAAGPASP
jgi:hypothetical protein